MFQSIKHDEQVRQMPASLEWRHNGRDGVSNHQPRYWLLNRLFRRRSKKTSKLRVTGLCAGNSPVTGKFPAQRASNAEMFPFDHVIMYYSLFMWRIPPHVGYNFCIFGKSLAPPVRFELNFTYAIFKLIWVVDGLAEASLVELISCDSRWTLLKSSQLWFR